MALGAVVGLAFLTKLTTVLFLPAPLLYVAVHTLRAKRERGMILKALVYAALIALVLAGPWYVLNTVNTVRFAIYSAQYDAVAMDRPDRVPAMERVAAYVGDLAGWPLAATVAVASLLGAVAAHRTRDRFSDQAIERSHLRIHLSRMTWLGSITAAAILLVPSYFDARFLLPIWPLMAIEIGRHVRLMMLRTAAVPRLLVSGGLAASLFLACGNVVRQPPNLTYWRTASLIDELVGRYGIATLGNVGNCIEWNVCKTGLLNELRGKPADCYVLHDLSKWPSERIQQALPRFDAIVVLERSAEPESRYVYSPGLNRSYDAAVERLVQDRRFVRIPAPLGEGLPHLSVYIKGTKLGRTERSPGALAGDHRQSEDTSRRY
jgi:hypothetical protein